MLTVSAPVRRLVAASERCRDHERHVRGYEFEPTVAPARCARRYSIRNAASGGMNTIDFAVPGAGVQVISPLSPLPVIVNPVLIDGFSQPGYSGTPLIELSGSQAGASSGLTITGPDTTIRGLDLASFGPARAFSSRVLLPQTIGYTATSSVPTPPEPRPSRT